jgi:hypothetical protein
VCKPEKFIEYRIRLFMKLEDPTEDQEKEIKE